MSDSIMTLLRKLQSKQKELKVLEQEHRELKRKLPGSNHYRQSERNSAMNELRKLEKDIQDVRNDIQCVQDELRERGFRG